MLRSKKEIRTFVSLLCHTHFKCAQANSHPIPITSYFLLLTLYPLPLHTLMNIIKTEIEGVLIIEPKIFIDNRGYFLESFSQQDFFNHVDDTRFVQDNESQSMYGVLRGLHFQRSPYAQAKLVRVIKGVILDVAVDIRKNSPTFGKYVSTELSEENKLQMYIPQGFAHGFVVLANDTIVQYKCYNYYHPEAEGSVRWNDPTLNIDWKIPHADIILSEKDKKSPLLGESNY